VSILEFPPVENADENGLVAIGGDLEIDSILLAYESGIFPWPISEDYPLAWFSPNPRGILKYDDFHLSKSFKKFLKKTDLFVEFNQNFETVIMNCAIAKRKDQDETWITDQLIADYINLHRAGFAYSAETYKIENGNKYLVGGVYGVCISNFFSGESMYYSENNASKLALYELMNKLNQNGISWIDTQMVTPVISHLGGSEISREKFLELISIADINKRIIPKIFNT
jgi:leucyl/phenylalanyl-tRNA--protein transferase